MAKPAAKAKDIHNAFVPTKIPCSREKKETLLPEVSVKSAVAPTPLAAAPRN